MWFPVCDSSLMSRVEAAFARKQFHFHWCETDLDRDSSNYLQRNVQMHWMAIVKEDKIRMSNCVCVAISIYAAKEYNHLRLRRAIFAYKRSARLCKCVCASLWAQKMRHNNPQMPMPSPEYSTGMSELFVAFNVDAVSIVCRHQHGMTHCGLNSYSITHCRD